MYVVADPDVCDGWRGGGGMVRVGGREGMEWENEMRYGWMANTCV